jgi:hypothetical protein
MSRFDGLSPLDRCGLLCLHDRRALELGDAGLGWSSMGTVRCSRRMCVEEGDNKGLKAARSFGGRSQQSIVSS